jgi:putative AlgH/UPF0301 family transcriptional regulator
MSGLDSGYVVFNRNGADSSLWFIFHHDTDGALAADLTQPHPHIPYKIFGAVLDFEDNKPEEEKTVLLGGPEQSDDAMIVLHLSTAGTEDSTLVNEDFAFTSYRLVLLPGKPPMLAGSGGASKLHLKKQQTDFLVILGFRAWETGVLESEIARGLWSCLPATPELIFHTPRIERLKKLRAAIN